MKLQLLCANNTAPTSSWCLKYTELKTHCFFKIMTMTLTRGRLSQTTKAHPAHALLWLNSSILTNCAYLCIHVAEELHL